MKAVLSNIGIEVNENRSLVNSLMKACTFINDRVQTRFAIHKDLLLVILREVKSQMYERNQPYLGALYQALFSTAYFGIFRVGELTTGDHPVLAKDVHIADLWTSTCGPQKLIGKMWNPKSSRLRVQIWIKKIQKKGVLSLQAFTKIYPSQTTDTYRSWAFLCFPR